MSASSEPDLRQGLGPIDFLAIGRTSAHRVKIAPASGGVQGGDLSAFLA